MMKIKAIVHPAAEGGYWAEVPALPGCVTEGDTWEEVTLNLRDAIEGWLAVANESYSSYSSHIEVVKETILGYNPDKILRE